MSELTRKIPIVVTRHMTLDVPAMRNVARDGDINSVVFSVKQPETLRACSCRAELMVGGSAYFVPVINGEFSLPSATAGKFQIQLVYSDCDGTIVTKTDIRSMQISASINAEGSAPTSAQIDGIAQMQGFAFADVKANYTTGKLEFLNMAGIKRAEIEIPSSDSGIPIIGPQGEPGERGEQGPKGDAGSQGVPGIDGKDGKDGADGKDGYTPIKGVDYFDGVDGEPGQNGITATIEIGAVATGEPGSEAKVENSGTEQNAIFNFWIPRGDKGEAVTGGFTDLPWCSGYFEDRSIPNNQEIVLKPIFEYGDISLISENNFIATEKGIYILNTGGGIYSASITQQSRHTNSTTSRTKAIHLSGQHIPAMSTLWNLNINEYLVHSIINSSASSQSSINALGGRHSFIFVRIR